MRASIRGKKVSGEGRTGGREAAYIIASKNQTAMAMARTAAHRQGGRHTYLHTSHSIDRAPNWLAGLAGWLVSCTAGFQAGSTTRARRTHIYIKPLSAYGRTMVRSLGPSVRERAVEGGKQEGKGRETDGRRDFIRAKRPCGCCGGGREGGREGEQSKAGHINKWISNGRGQLTLGVGSAPTREEGNTFIIIQRQIGDVRVTRPSRGGGEAAIVRATSFREIFLLLRRLPEIRIHVGKCRGRA